MRVWLRTNQGVSACLTAGVALLALYILTSDWTFQRLRDGFHLGSFTLLATGAMGLCCLSMMLDRRRSVTEPEMADVTWIDWLLAVAMMAICLGYFHLAWEIDFLLVTPFVMAAAVFLLGVRPFWAAGLAGLVTTGIVYGLFRLIGIRLPSNLVPF